MRFVPVASTPTKFPSTMFPSEVPKISMPTSPSSPIASTSPFPDTTFFSAGVLPPMTLLSECST
jgi:hypothetical protein